MNFKLGKIDKREVIICLLLIAVGYMSARLFTRMNAGFRVGGQSCDCTIKNDNEPLRCKDGGNPKTSVLRTRTFCTDQTTESNCKTSGGRTFISPNTCKWTGPPTPTPTPTPSPKPPAPAPTPPGKKPTGISFNCSGSTCVSVSGTKGKYQFIFDCQDNCPKVSFNCSGSTCIPVSGTKGKYDNLSDCASSCNGSSKPPTTTPTYSCSSTGLTGFNDICLKDNTALDEWDDECSKLDNCYSWYSYTKIWIYLIGGIIILFIIILLSI